jgi:alpha-beta hydrolase superfamily lysophospholipase
VITIVVLVALAVVAVALLGSVAVAWYLAETFTRSKRWRVEGSPADVLLRHEEIAFPATDGLSLRGWYLESPGARATVVLVHDVEGTRSDPSQGLLQLQRDYVRRGLHVLSFDLRGRGESSGGRDQLGTAELADVTGAVAYARRRSEGLPVVLHGFGLGASLALVAASEDLPVAGVIADSPFASTRRLLRRRHPRVPGLIFALAFWLARRLFDADVDAVEPLRAATRIAAPVCYIHAEGDTEVPIEDTLNLAAASLNPDDRIWRVPGSGHCAAYVGDPVGYLARCLDFIELVVPARLPVASAV